MRNEICKITVYSLNIRIVSLSAVMIIWFTKCIRDVIRGQRYRCVVEDRASFLTHQIIIVPAYDKIYNKTCFQWRQISLRIRAVWSESSLSHVSSTASGISKKEINEKPVTGLGGTFGCAVRLETGRSLNRSPPDRQHSFVAIDHKIFSTVILTLPLIEEGQLSVSGERMCTILADRLED